MFSLITTARLRRATTTVVGAVALLVAASGAAAAQAIGTLRFDEAGQLAFDSPYGKADVGRLRGTFLDLPGQPGANRAADLFCVDILHNVTFVPEGWTVYLTNLGGTPSMDYTRQGSVYADSIPEALTRYRKAAWLTDQFKKATTLADTAGIQGAMWMQFVTKLDPYYPNAAEEAAMNKWTAKADAFAATSKFATYNWSRFTVVTDTAAVGRGSNDWRGLQELITKTPLTTVPEPGTVALVGVGLAAAGAAARRRRRA